MNIQKKERFDFLYLHRTTTTKEVVVVFFYTFEQFDDDEDTKKKVLMCVWFSFVRCRDRSAIVENHCKLSFMLAFINGFFTHVNTMILRAHPVKKSFVFMTHNTIPSVGGKSTRTLNKKINALALTKI